MLCRKNIVHILNPYTITTKSNIATYIREPIVMRKIMPYKNATINISTNGLSHFFQQSHFALRATGSFIYVDKNSKI